MRRQLPAAVVAARPVSTAPLIALMTASMVVLTMTLTACSPGDGTDIADRSAPSTTAASVRADEGSPGDASVDGDRGADDRGDGRDGGDGAASTGVVEPTSPASPVTSVPFTVSIVEVPETGVPGLDSDDAFCAAWSRFGGSYQMIAVSAAFGDGTPEAVAALEEIASGTVVDAYRQLGENWPDALESEREVALEDGFGPFAGRMASALDQLGAAGATPEQVATISTAWYAALETRAPDQPDVQVDLPDDMWTIVDDAARRHVAASGTWFDDTSLVTRVETPLTDRYLATQCPDQGALAGSDADG